MTTYTDKDRSIIAQVAAKIASEIVSSGNANGASFRDAAQLAQQVIFDLAAAPMGATAPAPQAAPVLQAVPDLPQQSAQQAVAPTATDFASEIAAADLTAAAVQAAIPGAQQTLSSQPPYPGDTKDKAQKAANKEWAMALLQHDASQFWDNRADKASGEKKSTYPDFKHKDSGVGVWLD